MPKINPQQTNLFRQVRQKLPTTPGVYLFRDQTGQVLYIGKSVNLRNRVAAYFQKNQARLEPRIQQMVMQIAQIDFIEMQTELQALLLEDKLIKSEMPVFNIRQREFLNYQFLLLTKDVFPTFKIGAAFDAAVHQQGFGPFKDMYFAENVLKIIQTAFKIRSCRAEIPTQKCFQYEIHGCTGPCRDEISESEYKAIIEKSIRFLAGEATEIRAKLDELIQQKAAALEFEKAAEIKAALSFVNSFCKRQIFIRRFQSKNFVIHESEPTDVTHLFVNGRYHLVPGKPVPEKIGEIIQAFQQEATDTPEDIRFVTDRANLVYRWLHQTKVKYTCYFFAGAELNVSHNFLWNTGQELENSF